ncbi:copper resistance protein CopB, partial [Pseudomonas coronafaciens]
MNGSRNLLRLPALLLTTGLVMAPWAPALAAGMEGMDHGSHSMPMDAADSDNGNA